MVLFWEGVPCDWCTAQRRLGPWHLGLSKQKVPSEGGFKSIGGVDGLAQAKKES
jgi:hypothetical protein